MWDQYGETLVYALAAALVLCCAADLILSAAWSRFYYTAGLPILLLRIPVTPHHSNLPLPSRLNAKFRSFLVGSLVFRQIAPNTYGFRARLFEFSLLHVGAAMHGMLYFDGENNRLVMKGFVNWSTLCFGLILLAILLFPSGFLLAQLAALAFLTLVIVTVHGFDLQRFSGVAEFAARAWTREHSREPITRERRPSGSGSAWHPDQGPNRPR